MKLVECYIKEFGGTKNKRIVFNKGLCAFIGRNGAGKTTLAAFIKAMLYGIGDTKKANFDENDRKRYLPRSGAKAGGTLTFSEGGREYRIERSFGKRAADDTCAVYDTRTGKATDKFSDRIGEELFSIDVSGFERTLYLSERNLSASSDPDSISARLSSLVSTDVDIDALERAKRVLDEQRKFYTKRGGGGEISATRVELNSTNGEIESLKTAESRMASTSFELSDIAKKESELIKRGEDIGKRVEALKENGIRDALNSRLGGLKAELTKLTLRKNSVMEFFDGEIPSYEEIEKHRQMSIEARRLQNDSETDETPEYMGLEAYFDGRCTPVEIERARINADNLIRKTDEVQTLKESHRRLFSIRTPQSSEIEEIKKNYYSLKTGKSGPYLALIIIGTLLAVCGLGAGYLVDKMLYLLSCVGALILSSGLIASIRNKTKKSRRSNALTDFLRSVSSESGSNDETRLVMLDEMMAAAISIENKESELKQIREDVNAFLSKFFTRGWLNPSKATMEIVSKYERYLSLRASLSKGVDSSSSRKEKADRLSSAVNDFLRRFKLKSTSPFDELSEAMREYERLTSKIISIRGEIEGLTSMRGIYVSSSEDIVDSEALINKDKAQLDEEMRLLSRRRAALEAQYKADEEALSELDRLKSEREKLLTRVEKYEKNARIIALTAAHLGYAAENMTERYLGKSRQSLTSYASLLSESSSRALNIDTELQLTVTEGGKTSSVDGYSRGERELYGLCVRLGLVDALFADEEPFIILDDPFVTFDDEKISAAKSLLTKIGAYRQILYFTCSESRSFPAATRI